MATLNASFGGAFLQPFPVQAIVTDGAGTQATRSRSIIIGATSWTEIEYEPGTIRHTSAENAGSDRVFQVEKPTASVHEHAEVSRMNQEPPKSVRPAPSGSMFVRETWRTNCGTSDPQGNRMFTCIFDRTYKMRDPGSNTLGWSTDANGMRRWTPEFGYVLAAITPALDTDSQYATASAMGTSSAGQDTRIHVVASTETNLA